VSAPAPEVFVPWYLQVTKRNLPAESIAMAVGVLPVVGYVFFEVRRPSLPTAYSCTVESPWFTT